MDFLVVWELPDQVVQGLALAVEKQVKLVVLTGDLLLSGARLLLVLEALGLLLKVLK